MSVPYACRACGVSLQHCLEMRNDQTLSECGAYCCAPCAENPGLHESSTTTAELRPGDTIRAAGPTVRTVRTNVPPRTDSRWHVLSFEDGTSFWSAQNDRWEVLPQAAAPLPSVLREYAVRNTNGEIFPMPSRAYAQHVAEGGAPDLQAVSRAVPLWEPLR